MSFARRRAPIACLYCRHRKRRCDGEKPACGLCSSSGVSCEYPGKTSNAQRSDNELLQRIKELEALVEAQQEQLSQSSQPEPRPQEPEPHAASPPLSLSPGLGVDMTNPGDSLGPASPLPGFELVHEVESMTFPSLGLTAEAMMPVFSPRSWQTQFPVVRPLPYVRSETAMQGSLGTVPPSDDEEESIIIPTRHHTTTASLFTLRPLRNLVGYYPPNLFYDIESMRNIKTSFKVGCDLSLLFANMDMDQATTAGLISNFFAYIYPKFPVVHRSGFTDYFHETFQGGISCSADTAVCLMVLALGAIGNTEEPIKQGPDEIGKPYFSVAYHILTTQWAVTFNMRSQSTGLILAAVYFCFWAQPLAAWKMAYLASNTLQLLAYDPAVGTDDSDDGDMLSRLCWTCFAIECDSLSEFHLPRSGIEVAIDRMYFPRLEGHDDRDALVFLACCSIRRLLNRIHNAVYMTSKTGPLVSTAVSKSELASEKSAFSDVMSLENVIDELKRQLDAWYDSLPSTIKPDMSTNVPQDTQDAWLRMRYWSAKHIIGRPALIYATTSSNGGDLPEFVYRYAEMCVVSSRGYIETAIHTLDKRTHYSWMGVQACLSNSMMLVLAATNAKLQHLVPDIQDILESLPKPLGMWATPDSSAEAAILVLRTLRQKLRLHSFPKDTPN